MTLEQIMMYYKTGYKFQQATGLAANNWHYWARLGYIPLSGQRKIERLTNGRFKIVLEELGES